MFPALAKHDDTRIALAQGIKVEITVAVLQRLYGRWASMEYDAAPLRAMVGGQSTEPLCPKDWAQEAIFATSSRFRFS